MQCTYTINVINNTFHTCHLVCIILMYSAKRLGRGKVLRVGLWNVNGVSEEQKIREIVNEFN